MFIGATGSRWPLKRSGYHDDCIDVCNLSSDVYTVFLDKVSWNKMQYGSNRGLYHILHIQSTHIVVHLKH